MSRQILTFGVLSACLSCIFSTLASAASVQTISNPVPNGYMKMDGSLSDWQFLTTYAPDAIGDGSTGAGRPLDIDILQGAIAHDDEFVYFLWRNTGDNMIDSASNWVFIDIDQNPSTGLQNYLGGALGIDFNLGGTNNWYSWNADGTLAGIHPDRRTLAVGDSDGSGGADFIEYAVSKTFTYANGLSMVPASGKFDVVFWAEDTVMDTYPNNLTDWFTYDASGTYDYGVPGDANGDGVVTPADYLLIQANSFTNVAPGTLGDVNDDGFVDFNDFHQWKTYYPGGPFAAEAALAALGSVPEPASFGLAMGAVGFLLMHRRKREA